MDGQLKALCGVLDKKEMNVEWLHDSSCIMGGMLKLEAQNGERPHKFRSYVVDAKRGNLRKHLELHLQETPRVDVRDSKQGAPQGWIRDDLFDMLQTLELGRTPTQSEVFVRTHTRKNDRLWVDKRSEDVNDAFLAELKRLQDERQAIIDAGGPTLPPPPALDEDEVWTRIVGDCKQGRIYGMSVVPLHKYPPLFGDPDDDDIASGPPDLRKQVTLFNKEISQRAEAHAQRVATLEVVCAAKVRTLESTVQTQLQEVSS
ncbi:hypothetical protein PIB30_075789 [Stylosanthes scabra]|uniref:Uncharacterized protein n=1 Tax=Stylosanthes scabra TaxID=79078 RepID=A0ABU6QSE4_9FABA|nr:hypothetical protein [Stylosanthes scabra]